jgi:hypothetical protein
MVSYSVNSQVVGEEHFFLSHGVLKLQVCSLVPLELLGCFVDLLQVVDVLVALPPVIIRVKAILRAARPCLGGSAVAIPACGVSTSPASVEGCSFGA